MTEEEQQKTQTETDDIVTMMREMKETVDRQTEEIATLRKERADLMRELMKTTPTAPPVEDPPAETDEEHVEKFADRVVKRTFDIIEARR